MEPEEGRIDLGRLEKNVDLAHQPGLKVVLSTPSPAPPVWLVCKPPEVLMADAAGRRQEHGSRQRGCWTAPKYREHVARINEALAKKSGAGPRVWG